MNRLSWSSFPMRRVGRIHWRISNPTSFLLCIQRLERRRQNSNQSLAAKGFHQRAASVELGCAANLSSVLKHGEKVGLLEVGMFVHNSCSVMPAPSHPSTSHAVMRSPRMQGLPPRLAGSIVILALTANMVASHPVCHSAYLPGRIPGKRSFGRDHDRFVQTARDHDKL